MKKNYKSKKHHVQRNFYLEQFVRGSPNTNCLLFRLQNITKFIFKIKI